MSDLEKPQVGPDNSSSNGETEGFYDPDAGLSEEERKKAVRSTPCYAHSRNCRLTNMT
jgi:hypothetical protein